MATVSILANPLANTSSSSFSEPPQIISNPSNPPSDQPQTSAQPDGSQSVTEVIIEALRSKDRLFVLKLGEQMETLINERKSVLSFLVFVLLASHQRWAASCLFLSPHCSTLPHVCLHTNVVHPRTRIDVNPTTSYQRLLVHRCSTYYRLAPESDPTSKGIIVYPTPDSKMYVRS